ncbi:MAG: SagB/ThcOx family dehydrogenase [Deltaproteobacteria bacterium]|nr:SagB/ThcOx family dehydrogenase [Deltaproteobacteria bacterium]
MSIFTLNSNAAETIKLPTPDKTGGKPLMQVLDKRVSTRDYSAKALDDKTLSDILWAAYGVNIKGTRTIPTANNKKNLKVYALLASGVWFYDSEKHQLEQVQNEDLRPVFAKQDFVKTAPLTLVYVGSDKKYSALHAGSSYQNVGLYAASKGLAAVVRNLYDDAEVNQAMKLTGDDFVITTITVGWGK